MEYDEDHGFYRFSSPVKKIQEKVYKKKMVSSRINWHEKPLVSNKIRISKFLFSNFYLVL